MVQKKVRLVPRPWRTPDGAVNRPVLRMMLEGVLTYVMASPGVSLRALETKYNPILQPVCLHELLEVSQERQTGISNRFCDTRRCKRRGQFGFKSQTKAKVGKGRFEHFSVVLLCTWTTWLVHAHSIFRF